MPSVTRRSKPREVLPASSVEEALVGAMERLVAGGRSFTAVSVDELAREAGIARSTFYLHFRDKGELVQSLMQRLMGEVLQAAAVWLARPVEATSEDLRAALAGMVAAYQQHRAVMHAMVETAAYDAEVSRMFHEKMDFMIGQTRLAIRRVQQAGRAQPGVTADVADVLVWALERNCHRLPADSKPAQVAKVVDALVHVVWRSIYLDPA
jgi:AcrR family transcriptional regulator